MTIANLTPSFTRGMTALFAAFFLMFALAACEEQGTAEQTGEAIAALSRAEEPEYLAICGAPR